MHSSSRFPVAIVFLALTLPALAADEPIRLSEPVTVTEDYEEFGAAVTSPDGAISLGELVAAGDRYLGKTVTVSTRIAKVCRKKGCFFIAREGDTVARVTFKDYGFFIPTDSGGKTVTLAGTFERREISAAQAKHYRKDLGEPAAAESAPAMEYHIVATAVRIPRG